MIEWYGCMRFNYLKSIKILSSRLLKDFDLINEMHQLVYKSADMQSIKLGAMNFMSSFSSMLVMFLPIKVFLLLSGASHLKILTKFQEDYGNAAYFSFLISFTLLVYLFNIFLQLYISRTEKLNKNSLDSDWYRTKYGKYGKEFVKYAFKTYSGLIGDIMLVCMSIVLFVFISPIFSLFFILSQITYLIIAKYFIFTDNKYDFLGRLHLDVNQANTLLSGTFFLVIFSSLLVSYNISSMSAGGAILVLLLSRIANNAMKSILNKIYAIKKKLKRL
ncbi:hypothetical protein [Salinivibrio kushneri]|uniref:Uncharacterized protein n=1 Tax=Salinivibrio kushneri TaxID=1908198 RepID=A0AA47LR59_9GAMM|nr:hypothetical protein [Salinivibrio kushneri]WBA07877.1 hypothetical protein N8M53_08480 [Salinivibrio kushneri]